MTILLIIYYVELIYPIEHELNDTRDTVQFVIYSDFNLQIDQNLTDEQITVV